MSNIPCLICHKAHDHRIGDHVCVGNLQDDIERLTAENKKLEDALSMAIVNKDKAENQERLARVEIDRLNAAILSAKDQFDDIVDVASGRQEENDG